MKNILSIAALAVILSAGAAEASTNLVLDGTFSTPTNYGVTGNAPWAFNGYDGDSLHGVQSTTAAWQQPMFPSYSPTVSYATSPTPNFYYSDSAPNYNANDYIYQTITGLTAGQKYVLTFYQAAAVENPGTMNDTAGWLVTLGGATQASPLINPINSTTAGDPFSLVSMVFTATGASEVLSFASTGSGGPPFALLADVSLTSGVPEPGAWAMMLLGLGALGVVARMRRTTAAA